MPSRTASSTSASGSLAPSRKLKAECTCNSAQGSEGRGSACVGAAASGSGTTSAGGRSGGFGGPPPAIRPRSSLQGSLC